MQAQNYNKISGFSLIELMVVIAIIGILTAIATPIYTEYTTRATVTKALPVLESLTKKIAEYELENDSAPDDDKLGIGDGSDKYSDDLIEKINFTSTAGVSTLVATFKSDAKVPTKLHGKTLTFTANSNDLVVNWKCTSNITPDDLLPPSCRP